VSKRTIGADGRDELPRNEAEGVPVWHSIVGEGWEPVLFGEMTKQDEEALLASGWVNDCGSGGFAYEPRMLPRRRRKASYEISSRKSGKPYAYLKAARPGDCFMLTEDGELIPVDKPPTQSAE
jgi:hypothetical protein